MVNTSAATFRHDTAVQVVKTCGGATRYRAVCDCGWVSKSKRLFPGVAELDGDNHAKVKNGR